MAAGGLLRRQAGDLLHHGQPVVSKADCAVRPRFDAALSRSALHLLAEVLNREMWMERFAGPAGEQKLLGHLRVLYSKAHVDCLRAELTELRRLGMESLAQAKLEAVKRRFCDLSLYVKERFYPSPSLRLCGLALHW